MEMSSSQFNAVWFSFLSQTALRQSGTELPGFSVPLYPRLITDLLCAGYDHRLSD
jgi:hypothetical protein